MTAWQNRVEMTLGEVLKERYIWGRAFAGIRFDRSRPRPTVDLCRPHPGPARSALLPAAPAGLIVRSKSAWASYSPCCPTLPC